MSKKICFSHSVSNFGVALRRIYRKVEDLIYKSFISDKTDIF